MKNRAVKNLFLCAFLAAAGTVAWPAGIHVESLELLSHGAYTTTEGFSVDSRLYFDLSFEGGDKFAGLLKMDFLSPSIEADLSTSGLVLTSSGDTTADVTSILSYLDAAVSPRFKTAAVTARRLFGAPLELTYFVGSLDNLGSGWDFMSLYGSAPIGTELRGPMVYPNGIRKAPSLYYDGLDQVYGTGFKFGYVGAHTATWLYAYQDSDLGAGDWSGLFRGLLDAGSLKLEVFAGASYVPSMPYGLYRGGLLFNFAPGKVGQFLAQVGLTRWNPAEAVSMKDFFFLFEPRVNFDAGSLAVTVFYHPAYYRQKATGEEGSVDLNVDLRFGNISKIGSQGGAVALIQLRSYTDTENGALSVDVSPYFSIITSGIEWSFKLDTRLFPFPSPWFGMFKPFIGVKTSF